MGQMMKKASFNPGLEGEASSGHDCWSQDRTAGAGPEACFRPRAVTPTQLVAA